MLNKNCSVCDTEFTCGAKQEDQTGQQYNQAFLNALPENVDPGFIFVDVKAVNS